MFKRLLINTGLNLLKKHLLDKITYAPLSAYMNSVFGQLKSIADLVTDNNPDDKAQLAELWEREKKNILGDTIDAAEGIISIEVSNPAIREQLLLALEALEESLKGEGNFRIINNPIA